jgi:hypothetical protein
MVDQGQVLQVTQCPSYAAALGYMGVAAAVCLSNWGSAVRVVKRESIYLEEKKRERDFLLVGIVPWTPRSCYCCCCCWQPNETL